ncbi:39S ribosomal protein L55, mitochondrial-like [Uloborus diversus]|uniref:39S ribosomal protein L55, mitochondrial-like n=1 Tax=Uloborus diversus TaxID=327109 RepID=UPI002409908E|nr:39S ribosomal protein L55, mitochondrial-like [Uloborus diversus]
MTLISIFNAMKMSRFPWKCSAIYHQQIRLNSNKTCIARIGRDKYCRMYQTTVVNPDGSSFTIRYFEPRKIIRLPLDTSKLSAEELEAHINRRKPKEKVIIEEQIEDNFDLNRYSHLWKSKPNK